MSARHLAVLVLALAPLVVRADAKPSFESDAKPILARQPGLLAYVHAHFEVKEMGVARVPGHGDAAPQPPFIFNARPRGRSGPFYLALLIQPGPPGHIMKVADVRKLPVDALPPQEQASPAPPPVALEKAPKPAPSQPLAPPSDASAATSEPTADTPSGPVKN